MVTPLVRKLLRDLAAMRGQVVTIALVVACGIASYVALRSAYVSLETARDRHYAAQRFGDAFARLSRAPNSLRAKLEAIPGVAVVETRVVADGLMPLEDLPEPAVGEVVGLPSHGEPRLNALALRRGRMFEPGRADEAVVSEAFANAHGLEPGATLPIVLEGVMHRVRVVGVALSPEYVFAMPPGRIFADDKHFGVLWMDGVAIAPALKLDGAFDDVVLSLQPGASKSASRESRETVLAAVDDVLRPYGGRPAYGRDMQASHQLLSSEFAQLEQMTTVIPAAFLGVAAFLLNVVLGRVVQLQRGQIATLKAVGYRDREIALHYLQMVTLVVLFGAALGLGLGLFLGKGMLGMYAQYYRFPALALQLSPRLLATAVLASFAAGVIGALATLRHISKLPPAEAMRPEAPAIYRRSWLERIGLARLLGPATWMVARELLRRPLRTSLSVAGIAMSVAVIVGARFTYDAMDALLDVGLLAGQREDVTVGFRQVVDDRAINELAHLPGVLAVEPERVVPARLRHGPRSRALALTGRPEGSTLHRVVEWPEHVVALPRDGVVLTKTLADRLGVVPGDELEVEVLEGARPIRSLRVAATSRELLGLGAYVSLETLHAMLDEQEGLTSAALLVDPRELERLDARLRELPGVASVSRKEAWLELFRKQSTDQMSTTTMILVIFGATIAIGVVYNDARIAVSMRSRDLATLRVLGFTTGEVASIVYGELATCVLLGLAPGLQLGIFLMHQVFSGATVEETFRMPATASPLTFAFAIGIVVFAAAFSALLVRDRLDRLDLVEVLKARD
jgi:putative ABC transport system permease protein